MGNCFQDPFIPPTSFEPENFETPEDRTSLFAMPILHADVVFGVCFGKFESDVFSCSADKTVARYNWKTGYGTSLKHTSSVHKILYAEKTEKLYSGARDGVVRVWKQEEMVQALEAHSMVVMGLAINAHENVLVSGSRDYSVKFWDLEVGKAILENSIQLNMVTSLKWLDENSVVQTSEDLVTKIWDCRSGCVVQTLPPATHFPLDCDVTPSGLILLSMTGFDSDGCTVELFDRRSLKGRAFQGHTFSVNGISAISDESAISVSKDGSAKFWNLNSGVCEKTLRIFPNSEGSLTCVRTLGDAAVIGSSKDNIFVLDLKSREIIAQTKTPQ